MVGVVASGNAWKEWREVGVMTERGDRRMIHGGRHPGRWGEDGRNKLAFG
jgi:hypothetical protein